MGVQMVVGEKSLVQLCLPIGDMTTELLIWLVGIWEPHKQR
jgi:hypothetical protein